MTTTTTMMTMYSSSESGNDRRRGYNIDFNGHEDTFLSVALTLFFVPVRFRTLSESETSVSNSETAVSAAETTVSAAETTVSAAEMAVSTAETTVSGRFGRRNDRFPATETAVFVLAYP